MSGSNQVLYSSANSSNSTLRPRAARLISYADEDNASSDVGSNLGPATGLTSRGSSPSHEPRIRPAVQNSRRSVKPPQDIANSAQTNRRSSNGLWDSWSQLQGIASTILGSDTQQTGRGNGNDVNRKPVWMKQDRTYGSARSTSEWGPDSHNTAKIASGLVEDRHAALEAKKREALLTSASQASRDNMGRFKRKGSDASMNIRVSASESNEYTLVYRHSVQSHDTMAGVTIKYACQPEVFRKANRFWPNDNIQVRKQVLLPVNACSIRGLKVEDAGHIDLLGEPVQQADTDQHNITATPNGTQSPFPELSPAITPISNVDENEYKHDSWVQLPGFSSPTQILRVPRRNTGYFPPPRRKSNTNLLSVNSTTSSPRTSFETLRHPPSHAAQQAQLQHSQPYHGSASLSSSPVRHARLSATTSRQRSSSTVSTTSTTVAGNTFASALRGPGGVGTLSGLRTEVSRPGPGDDPLNQRFAKYLPDVAPPANEDVDQYVPPTARAFSSLALALPRASTDTVRSNRSASGGSSVGDWVKKLARPGISRKDSDRTINQNTLAEAAGMGDLIELETNSESMSHLDPARKDNESPPFRNKNDSGVGDEATGKGKGVQDEHLLDARFPVRGRLARAYVGD